MKKIFTHGQIFMSTAPLSEKNLWAKEEGASFPMRPPSMIIGLFLRNHHE